MCPNRGEIYDESPEAAKKEAKTFVDKMCPKYHPPPNENEWKPFANLYENLPLEGICAIFFFWP